MSGTAGRRPGGAARGARPGRGNHPLDILVMWRVSPTVDSRTRPVGAVLLGVVGSSAVLVSLFLPWHHIVIDGEAPEVVTAFGRLNPIGNVLLLIGLGVSLMPPRSLGLMLVGAMFGAYGFGAVWGAAALYGTLEGADATTGAGVRLATLGWTMLWLTRLVGWPPRGWQPVDTFLGRLRELADHQ